MFSEFLAGLLSQGRIVFRSAGPPRDRPSERDVAALAEAFATASLSVAGPPIAFDPRVAVEAAEVVRQASWALVDREERAEDLRRRLRMARGPSSASEHLSADLTLRYLPPLLGRAQALDPTDPLAEILVDLLRRWPLSGALSDVEEAPLGPTDFGGHPGLLLLFAERVAARDRPAWRPEPSGPAYDYHQLVTGPKSPASPNPGWPHDG